MRAFPPLEADSPIVRLAKACPGCDEPFVAGDVPTLLIVGPGADEDARRRRDEARAYNAIAVPVHWECSTQDPDR